MASTGRGKPCRLTKTLYAINMKRNFIAITILVSFNLGAGESYVGSYSTVSESECNYELVLLENEKGDFTFTCRREDGSHIDDKETKTITWQSKGNDIIVLIDGKSELFNYKPSLACISFGQKGTEVGLVGYGTEFWKQPIKCK
jgi:hypothetical protein